MAFSENKIQQFNEDADVAHRIIHGGTGDVIETDGGPVRSLAKLIADNQEAIDNQAALGAQLANIEDPTKGAALVGRATMNVATLADLSGAPRDKGIIARVISRVDGWAATQKGPRGGGDFYWNSESTEADNGGTVIAVSGLSTGRWIRLFEGDIRAAWFGTVGNGIANDGPALLSVLRFADGRPVKLEPGDIYQITSSIEEPLNINLSCDGFPKAVIRGIGQGFRLLRISNDTPVFTRTLVANTEINNHYWAVDDLTGIEPGMLMEIVSDKDWYFKEAVAMKSELHRVRRVTHGFVQAERNANDGYDLTTETVVAKFYNPLRLRLENIRFEAQHVINERGGLVWSGTTSDARIIDCDFIDGSLNGLTLARAYAAKVIGGHVHGTNGTMGATGAVYGVILWGCTDSVVDGTKFSDGYAGVNVTGNDVISIGNEVRNTLVTGGGYSNEDLALAWDQQGVFVRNQRGHGSRGPSDKTRFINNTIEHMESAFVIRGRNTEVKSNTLRGRFRTGAIELYLGTGTIIQDNVMDPSFFAGKSSFTWDGLHINSHIPDVFLSIQDSWSYVDRQPVIVKGNRVVVNKAFIELYDGGQQHLLRISDNDISMYAENPTDTLPMILARSQTVTINPASYIEQYPVPEAGNYARMKLFSDGIILTPGVSVVGWSESYTPTVVGTTGWTGPVLSSAFLTLKGRYATIELDISGGTITAESGAVYSVRFSVPYLFSSFSSAAFIRGTATGLGKAGLVSGDGATSSAQLELLNDGNPGPVRVTLTYRIG